MKAKISYYHQPEIPIQPIIYVNENEFEQITSGERIDVRGEDVCVELLKRILTSPIYFQNAYRYLNDMISKFGIAYQGDTSQMLYLSRVEIIEGLKQLIDSKKVTLEGETKKRFELLSDSVSFEKYLDRHENVIYEFEADGNEYEITIGQLFETLQLPQSEFDNLWFNDDVKNIDNIPKTYVLWAIHNFIKRGNFLQRFVVPEEISKRYADLLEKIDIEAINRLSATADTKYQEVVLDEGLKNLILEGMPKDASQLEKAIYIYIKMCKVLTYNQEYFAVSQKGKAAEKHEDISYVSNITPDFPEAVCFEFNIIYAKFLADLGIKFHSEYGSYAEESYGHNHVKLKFRVDKFLMMADAVKSILNSDLTAIKLNQPLYGLLCINKNRQTKSEFNEALTKMYKLIAQQERGSQQEVKVEEEETLEELLSQYGQTTENIKAISVDEKIFILLDKARKSKTTGIDTFAYIIQLRRLLFAPEEINNNMSMTIIRNNRPLDLNKEAMPTAIFTINPTSMDEYPEKNRYYCYNPNEELVLMSRESLQAAFDTGILEYIDDDDTKIPGIIDTKNTENSEGIVDGGGSKK